MNKILKIVLSTKKHRLVYIENDRGFKIYVFQKFKNGEWIEKKMKSWSGFICERDNAIKEFNKKHGNKEKQKQNLGGYSITINGIERKLTNVQSDIVLSIFNLQAEIRKLNENVEQKQVYEKALSKLFRRKLRLSKNDEISQLRKNE